MKRPTNFVMNKLLLTLLLASALSACKGGSNDDNTTTSSPWNAGEFLNEGTYKNFCQVPRTGTDPFTNEAYQDKAGLSIDEKMWLRSWSNNSYLWYDEIEDNNPDNFESVAAYYEQLKTSERTDSGAKKDNFHFMQSTQEYNELAQDGVESGYGINWIFVNATVPRTLLVGYTEDNSPAEQAGVKRGFQLTHIDGVDVIHTEDAQEIDFINQALLNSRNEEQHSFTFTDNHNERMIVDITSAILAVSAVQNAKIIQTDDDRIGYVQFNRFISSGQSALIDAFSEFQQQGITELVLDLRYNGGGLLAMSSQLAYMVAGSAQTKNLIFEQSVFNEKHPLKNPVTGDNISPIPFLDKAIDWEQGVYGDALPSVNLSRVYVLTTEQTCSASESLINGLRGINLEVIQIGATTCGKPYGFYPADNCGTTYFTIQFKGVNEQGFGEYSDGFSPTPQPQFNSEVKGCLVNDDFEHALGDESEGLFSAAINYIDVEQCPENNSAKQAKSASNATQSGNNLDIRMKSFIFENKIYQPLPDKH